MNLIYEEYVKSGEKSALPTLLEDIPQIIIVGVQMRATNSYSIISLICLIFSIISTVGLIANFVVFTRKRFEEKHVKLKGEISLFELRFKKDILGNNWFIDTRIIHSQPWLQRYIDEQILLERKVKSNSKCSQIVRIERILEENTQWYKLQFIVSHSSFRIANKRRKTNRKSTEFKKDNLNMLNADTPATQDENIAIMTEPGVGEQEGIVEAEGAHVTPTEEKTNTNGIEWSKTLIDEFVFQTIESCKVALIKDLCKRLGCNCGDEINKPENIEIRLIEPN